MELLQKRPHDLLSSVMVWLLVLYKNNGENDYLGDNIINPDSTSEI